MTYRYRAYGLVIASDIALHGPLPASESAVVDVDMTQGAVPDRLGTIEASKRHWQANGSELLLEVPEVGRFHVRDGRTVRYLRTAEAGDEAIGAFLLGSCIGALLHQRGTPVLHGACLEVGGKAIAICGKSGRGKSTTAAALVERGARIMSDDLTVFGALDPPTVMPGYPQSKLTGEALERLGESEAGLRQLDDERGKYAVPRGDVFVDRETPLAAIFVLETGPREEPIIMPIPGLDTVRALIRHTYRPGYLVRSRIEAYFRACDRIIAIAPIWAIVRPRSTDSTRFVVSAIAREIDRIVPGALTKADDA